MIDRALKERNSYNNLKWNQIGLYIIMISYLTSCNSGNYIKCRLTNKNLLVTTYFDTHKYTQNIYFLYKCIKSCVQRQKLYLTHEFQHYLNFWWTMQWSFLLIFFIFNISKETKEEPTWALVVYMYAWIYLFRQLEKILYK